MNLDHSKLANRKFYTKNLVKVHMNFLYDRAPYYFEMMEDIEKNMPNSCFENKELWDTWEMVAKEYMEGKTSWDKFTGKIESWTVQTLNLYEQFNTR